MTSILVLLAGWHVTAQYIVDKPLFLAAPIKVVEALQEDLQSGALLTDLRVSMTEFAVGMVMGVVAGVILGVMVGASRRIGDYADPFIAASYSAPLIAFAPLFVLWFGLGLWSKIVIVFIVVFFPMVINVSSGIRTTNPQYLEVARSFGVSRRHMYSRVLIPANIPAVTAGIRISLGRGLVAIVVGELFGARDGLGHSIVQASQSFDTARVFSGVFVLMLIGAVLMEVIRAIEKWVAPWAFVSEEAIDRR